MQFLKKHRTAFVVVLVFIAGVSIYLLTKEEKAPAWTTGNITTGPVRELVSVSGVTKANAHAELTFPVSGTVRSIDVNEGSIVVQDQILATLEQDELLAERQDAYATLLIAQANKQELERGPREEKRSVTDAAVAIATADLDHARSETTQAVQNAYRTLLSTDLEALPINRNTEAIPPTITGTYTCDTEGTYTVSFFSTSAQSGYGFRLSGLESGTYTAYSEAPGPLGTCGLSMKLTPGESYGNREFTIDIPNTQSSSYTTNYNAYLAAQENAKNTVRAAELVLKKALREQSLANAAPREEELARANAAVVQAQARLQAIDARIRERTLRAPFPGTISAIELVRGEVSTGKSMTLVASDIFELTVRVPEIDITHIIQGQHALVRFDARPNETIEAYIGFIAETATEIDGVAYFEAKLRFTDPPEWMRSGLNADVDIITNEVNDSLRAPKRFLVTEGDAHYLLFPNGVTTRRVPVELVMSGNDGFVALKGDIRDGDTIVAP